MRAAYDRALGEAGMVLVQQTAAGAESHHVSPSVAALLGWDAAAFLTPGTLRSIVHTEDLGAFRTAASDLESEAAVVRLRHVDGSFRSFRFGVSDSGPDQPLTLTLVDVSCDVPAAIRRRRAFDLFEQADHAVLILRFTERDDVASLVVEDLNPAAVALLRRPVVGRLSEVFGAVSLQLLANAAFDVVHTGDPLTFERLQLIEFPERHLSMALRRLSDGTVALQLDDVTQQVALEDHLRHQALHDQRTGLPNLALLEDRLAELTHGHVAAQHVPGSNAPIGLLAVDLRAPHTDDLLVVEIARRLVGTMAPGTLIARVGEGRLAALTPALSHAEELATIAQVASAAVAIPFDIAGDACAVDAVIGAAACDPSTGAHRLLSDAEGAARRAAAEGRPFGLADDALLAPPSGLFHQVRTGLGHGDMELRFQPIIDLRTGRVAKVEALLRWSGDADGPPPSALELAETSGVVDALPRWMLGEAAAAASSLQGHHPGMKVAVNLGPLGGTGSTDLLDGFVRLLNADGIDPAGRLEVEISETALTDNPLSAADLVAQLHSLGLSVVIDDFGAGYTSLSTVSGLAVDGLKVDRTFIATLTSIPADAAVVRSTVEFCHQLGIEVTAVGVADERTLAELREMRCDLAQGFLLSEPVTLDQLAHRITELEHAFV